ncbi:hypothetical protein ACFL2Q_11920 [Thermodesulfobacteriota bacterium]
MNPFNLFEATEIYKVALFYFSESRGFAIAGRRVSAGKVEVIHMSGEVDPHTGEFTALDCDMASNNDKTTLMSIAAFDELVSFLASRMESDTLVSVIEPHVIKSLHSQSHLQHTGQLVQ